MMVEDKQEYGGEGDGARNWPRGVVVEQGEGDAGQGKDDSQGWKVAKSEAGDDVGAVVGVGTLVFPRKDEEAVEAAEGGEEKCGGEQGQTEVDVAGDGGNEDGGGEEEADGDLFG